MASLSLYLFGSPRIEIDDEPIQLNRHKAIALLAYLAVNGQSYSRDSLATLLWPDSARARGLLRRTLSDIKKYLGEGWLNLADSSVGLNPQATIWVDVIEFRRLVAKIQILTNTEFSLQAEESNSLEKAVELFSEDFLAGFSLRDTPEFDEWQYFQAENLRQELANVLNHLVQVSARASQFEQAIMYARRWLALDNLQEAAHRQLILLYAWSGQRNAALRQYRTCAQLLADELGVEPDEETKELYKLVTADKVQPIPGIIREVKRDVHAIPIPQRRWSRLLVGRENELLLLQTALAETRQGQGNMFFLTGEAGIGKTRLAFELGRQAQQEGVLFLMGRAYLQEQNTPYSAWLEIIRTYRNWSSGSEWDRVTAGLETELARILPELGRATSQDVDLGQMSQQQDRLFEAILQLFLNIARQRPCVLFLDDIQWLEESSLQLLQKVAQGTRNVPILLIAAYRSLEMEERPPLMQVINQMNRERLFQAISLKRLPPNHVHELLQNNLESPVTINLGQLIFDKTRGNPFFVEEMGLYLQEENMTKFSAQGWQLKEGANISLPDSITAVVEERLARYDETLRQTMQMAAIIGVEFSFNVLLQLTGKAEEKLIDEVEAGLQMHILVERRLPGEEVYTFVDEIIREVLYESISRIRRRRYHVQVGQAMELVYKDEISQYAGELAHHFVEGNDREKALTYLLQAGDEATRVYAFQEARQYYESSLALFTANELPRKGLILKKLTQITLQLAQIEESLQFGKQALEIFEKCQDKLNAFETHLLILALYTSSYWDGSKEVEGLVHLEAAAAIAEERPDSVEKGLIYQRTSHLYLHHGEPAQTLIWAEKAIETFTRIKVPMGTSIGTAWTYTGQIDRGINYNEHNWEMVLQAGNPLVIAVIGHELALTLALVRHVTRAATWGERIYQELGNAGPLLQGFLTRPLALIYTLAGRMDEAFAISQLQESVERETRAGCYFEDATGIGFCYFRLGKWERAKRYLVEAIEIHAKRKNWASVAGCSWTLGTLFLAEGDPIEAETLLLKSLDICRQGGNVLVELWVLPSLVELYVQQGQIDKANQYIERGMALLNPEQSWYGLPAGLHLAQGMVATANEDWDEAESAFSQTIAMNHQYHLPWDEAKAHYAMGQMLLRRQANGDQQLAVEKFNQALTIFQKVKAEKEIRKLTVVLENL